MYNRSMKIYLAGSVPKGDKEAKNYIDWRKVYIAEIKKSIKNSETFDPNIFYKLEGDSKGVAGADCWNIKESDLVLANAEEKLGAGSAMELVVAKYFSKPVITVLPKDSHHRRSNLEFEGRMVEDWTHPFIETFSDFIIEDISEIGVVIKKIKDIKIKNINVIDESVEYAKSILEEERVY